MRSGAAMRRRRAARALRRSCLASSFMAAMTLLVALRATCCRCSFLGMGRRPIRRRSRSPHAAGARRELLHRGRRARQSRPVRLRGLNDTRVPLLFAALSFWLDRLYRLLGVRLHARARRLRHLDRPVARHRALCGAADLALPLLDRAALSSGGRRQARLHDRTPDDFAPRPSRRRRRRHAGGPVFVPYTLPGEIVEVEPFPGHPDRRHLLRVETRERGAHRADLSAFRRVRRLPDPALGFRALSRLEARPRRRGACAGRARCAGRRTDRRAWRGAAARGIPCAAQRSTTCSRSASRPTGRITSSPIDRCPVLAPSLDGAIPAAWAIAEALGAMKKPLDIQVTATDAGLDVDVRGSGPLRAAAYRRARAACRARTGSRGSRATAS